MSNCYRIHRGRRTGRMSNCYRIHPRFFGPEHLLQVAKHLVNLPDTPLHLCNPIIPVCLKIARALDFLDLSALLDCTAPQLSVANLQESKIGFGFCTPAQTSRDLFSSVFDAGRAKAKFPAMALDPDYWLALVSLRRAPVFAAFRAQVVCQLFWAHDKQGKAR